MSEEYREMFVSEAEENIDTLNNSLLELEENPEKKEPLDEMFRAAHSLKGSAKTMGYEKISELAHTIEDLMDELREHDQKVEEKTADILFEGLDKLEELVEKVGNGESIDDDLSNIFKKLESAAEKKEDEEEDEEKEEVEEESRDTEEREKQEKVSKKTEEKSKSTIRIDANKIDELQDLTGELLISQMQASRIASEKKIEELEQIMDDLDRLTSDLQHTILSTRMASVDYLFGKFPRLVRDLSKQQGKEINLEMEGRDTELDRLVMDEINEPVVHLIRNAIDHGIEPAEERKEKGKDPEGTIKLDARRAGDYVYIEVSDDGRGIDVENVKQTAIENGLVTESKASEMSQDEVYDLLGTSGFSTKKKATEISGRGVGFDVVKRKVKSLGGSVKVKSEEDLGTTVSLKLPLTTAIIQSLMIKIGEDTYAIPLRNVEETVNIEKDDLKTINNKEIIQLRGNIIPVKRMRQDLYKSMEKKTDTVVVVRYGEELVGLMVDSILEQRETVIKPLKGIIKGIEKFGGATILPDGRVALVLDIGSLVG